MENFYFPIKLLNLYNTDWRGSCGMSIKQHSLHRDPRLTCVRIEKVKSGFMANVKWREEPGFGMMHHIYSGRNICNC